MTVKIKIQFVRCILLKIFVYLAARGLSRGTWDLDLQHSKLLVAARGTEFPDHGSNPGAPAWGAWSVSLSKGTVEVSVVYSA